MQTIWSAVKTWCSEDCMKVSDRSKIPCDGSWKCSITASIFFLALLRVKLNIKAQRYHLPSHTVHSFLFFLPGGQPGTSRNKKLKPGLKAAHRRSPNNRSRWGGERRRRVSIQEASSGRFGEDKSWVGGLGWVIRVPPPDYLNAEHTPQIIRLIWSWQLEGCYPITTNTFNHLNYRSEDILKWI